MDIIQLLIEDHVRFKEMFDQCAYNCGSPITQEKAMLVERLHLALTIHSTLEGETVYPVFNDYEELHASVTKALKEHEVAKMLLVELGELQCNDRYYDAKVNVLGEYMLEHIMDEEREILADAKKWIPQAVRNVLGEQVEAHRQVLLKAHSSSP